LAGQKTVWQIYILIINWGLPDDIQFRRKLLKGIKILKILFEQSFYSKKENRDKMWFLFVE
jgi:hypothetical protein